MRDPFRQGDSVAAFAFVLSYEIVDMFEGPLTPAKAL